MNDEMENQVLAEYFDKKRNRRIQVDSDTLTRMLFEDREFARTGKLGLEDGADTMDRADEGGRSPWRADPRAAVQATMALAKLHGHLVKRTELTIVDNMRDLTDDELRQFIDQMQSKVTGSMKMMAMRLAQTTEPDENIDPRDAVKFIAKATRGGDE